MIACSSASVVAGSSFDWPSTRSISPLLRRMGGSPTRMWRSEPPASTSMRSSFSIASRACDGSLAEAFTSGTGGEALGPSEITRANMPVDRWNSPSSSTTIDTLIRLPCNMARTAKTESSLV